MTPVASCRLYSSLPANDFGRRIARRPAVSPFSSRRKITWLTPFRIDCKVYPNSPVLGTGAAVAQCYFFRSLRTE